MPVVQYTKLNFHFPSILEDFQEMTDIKWQANIPYSYMTISVARRCPRNLPSLSQIQILEFPILPKEVAFPHSAQHVSARLWIELYTHAANSKP